MSFGTVSRSAHLHFLLFSTAPQIIQQLKRSSATTTTIAAAVKNLKAHKKMSTTAPADSGDQQQRKKVAVPSNAPCRRRLAAFDFDYTVVAQNTDTVIRDLLAPDKLTPQLSALIDGEGGWTAYMAEVFKLLYEQQQQQQQQRGGGGGAAARGIAQIRDTIRCIPEVPGFVRLLKWLRDTQNFDLIIISDSNSVFIGEWLQAHGLADCFAAVFTNPAHFDDAGRLHIAAYHHQTDCRLSAANLCKGRVLEHFVVEQDLRYNVRYERVVYVGDGNNDICPVLRLRVGDIACARRGFALDKQLVKNREKMQLRAELLVWQTGFDLQEQLEAVLQRRRRRRSDCGDDDEELVAPLSPPAN